MRPVALRVSPIFAAEMKLSFRSKLIARTTPGLSVRTDRPMAESASVLIIPPWTKPEWLAMSSVGVISTVAVPTPVSTSVSPSHSQAREEGACLSSLTALALRNGEASRGRSRDQSVLIVQDIGLAEHQRLLHFHNPADRAKAARDHRPDEIDLQLDRRIPEPVLLQRRQRHTHRSIRDLRDHPALHDPAAVTVLRAGLELEHNAPGLRLADSRPERFHPSVRLGSQQRFGSLDVPHRPRRP